MVQIERLTKNYTENPPRLSFNGSEGQSVTGMVHSEWPHNEEKEHLGDGSIIVWRSRIPAGTSPLPVEGYCVVNACLDVTGRSIPERLPLFQEMEGHELIIVVYVDKLGCIRMRAIGGFTSLATRSRLVENVEG